MVRDIVGLVPCGKVSRRVVGLGETDAPRSCRAIMWPPSNFPRHLGTGHQLLARKASSSGNKLCESTRTACGDGSVCRPVECGIQAKRFSPMLAHDKLLAHRANGYAVREAQPHINLLHDAG